MKQYLDILKKVVEEGELKENRTDTDTLAIPPQAISHDLRKGFPLLTTKKVAKRSMLVELEGFIGGITDKRWYQERGCKVWNEWSNPLNDDKDDLGPIYGYQWRSFGERYDSVRTPLSPTNKPFDQLSRVVNTLKKDPNSRRMVCSAWSPLQLFRMALPPCHLLFVVQHINGVLHLHWTQRSCDMFLGVPFNLASYAMLLTLLAKESGMVAGTVNGSLVDCHLYVNHLDQAKEQLSRIPGELPTVEFKNWTNFWDWKHPDIKWVEYSPQAAIKGEVAV